MRKALTRYQVDPSFLPVLYSFGDNPHLAECGSSNASSQKTDDGSRSKIALPSQNFPSLITCKTCHIRFDTAKRITGRPIHRGLFDKPGFTITILLVKNSIFSYSCIRSPTAFLRDSCWPLMISLCVTQICRVSAKILIGYTFCFMPCIWTTGDGISDT